MSSPEVQCTTIIINRDVPDPAPYNVLEIEFGMFV